MKLFTLKNYKLEISEEAYLLKPLAILWDRDKSKQKEIALGELAMIYFLEDFKSDFDSITDEDEKFRQVKHFVKGIPKEWKEDTEFNEARKFYREREETVLTQMLTATKIGYSKLEKHLKSVDLSAVDKSGKPKYNAKQFSETIKQMPDTALAMQRLEELVKKEKETKNTLRGGRAKGLYAD